MKEKCGWVRASTPQKRDVLIRVRADLTNQLRRSQFASMSGWSRLMADGSRGELSGELKDNNRLNIRV